MAFDTYPLPASLDLSHLHVILTGGSSGIGLEATKVLCAKRAHVYICGSDMDKGQAALRKVRCAVPSAHVTFYECDLTSLASVRTFARAWKALGVPLHCLVLNAGTFLVPYRRSPDGFEQTVAASYTGHFYLAHLLLDDLRAAPPARIVWVSSVYEQLGTLDMDDIGGEFARDGGLPQYARSKLMELMAMREMSRRLKGTGVDVLGAQPGLVSTPLWHHNPRAGAGVDALAAQPGLMAMHGYEKNDWRRPTTWFNNAAARVMGQTPRRGAIPLIHAAAAPELDGHEGAYITFPYLMLLQSYAFGTSQWRPLNPRFYSERLCRELYERTCDLLEEKTGAPLPNRLLPIYRQHPWREGVCGASAHHPLDVDLPPGEPALRRHRAAAYLRSWLPF